MNKTKSNRYIGDSPKIGIWPTIDGRLGGVKESFEEQTMNMDPHTINMTIATQDYYPAW